MSLLFPGYSGSFRVSGPYEWNISTFGLDQLIVPYRGRFSDLETFLNSHHPGEGLNPNPNTDNGMFLMSRIPDDHKQFPTVRMLYMGKRSSVPPPPQQEFDDDRLTASSKRSRGNIILTQPLVLEYYAPTSILTTYTRSRQSDQAPNPPSDPRPINLTSYDTTYSPTGVLSGIIGAFFDITEVSTTKSVEVVPGQWWQNVNKKTKLFGTVVFVPPAPGTAIITLASPGSNYRVGDILTFSSAGQNARLTVTQVLVAWGQQGRGGVYAWTVDLNTFHHSATLLPAIGGFGTGAKFNVTVI